MTLARTDEQRMLDETLDGHLAGLDRRSADLWPAVVGSLGLGALGVDEAREGLGPSTAEAMIVARAIGRYALPVPWSEHFAAVRVVDRLGDPDGTLATAIAGEAPLADTRATILALAGPHADWAADAITLAHCAEMVGLAETMLADTVAYTRERKQFGVAIATFQVLRFRMADMQMALEQARAATDYATGLLDADDATRAKAVSSARVTVGDAVKVVGEGAVQLHGGMGLTTELRLGDFFRRSRMLIQADGGTQTHLRRYASAA